MAGWDYPPVMGSFGIVSPGICPNCLIINTLWWALVNENNKVADLNDSQMETLNRILGEPGSIEVPDS